MPVIVSVIVPVYNVEKYLYRCVESLMNQTFSDYEILLIDDGSTDDSGSICDELAEKYDEVEVFHKKNGGLGSARNYGLSYANGDYVCFVDSDDTVRETYIEKLFKAITESNADISICGYEYRSGKHSTINQSKDRVCTCDELLREFSCGNALCNFAWNKMFKIDLISHMEMLYSDRHCAEDMYFNCYYYRLIKKAIFIHEALYVYYVNFDSLTMSRREGFWNDMLLVYNAFSETAKIKNLEPCYADNLYVVLLRNCILNFYKKPKTSLKEFTHYVDDKLNEISIKSIHPDVNKLQRIDCLIFKYMFSKSYKKIHWLMIISIILKSKFSLIYSKIRSSTANGN